MSMKKMSAVALSLMLLTGCSSGQTTQESTPSEGTTTETTTTESTASESTIVTEITSPVEITFWHAMNGAQEESLTKLTEAFMAENPNITVTLQNQSSYNDLQQKLTATYASPKNLPTMTQAYADWMFTPIQDELVVNLSTYINDATIGFDNFDDILPGLVEAVTVDGNIYGIPFNKSTEVIWYNKTLFDELGLVAPTTYEELAEVSKVITENKGIAGAGFDSLSNYYTTFLKNEGQIFEPSFDVTSEASAKAANFYLDGIKEGYFRIAGTDKYLSGPLGNETVAMYMGSMAGESFVKQGAEGKFEVGVAPYPSEYSIQQGTDLYVFSSATPEQQTASYEYLKFLTTTENQITWAIDTGYMPIRSSAIEADEYKNSGSLVAQILGDATENLYVNPVVSGADSAYRESATVLEGILADTNSDVTKALEAYQTTLTTIWE